MMERFYAIDHYPFDAAIARGALQNLILEAFYGAVWLILDAAQPVGYVVLVWGYSLEYRGRDATIDEIYIEPDYRGRGIGRATLGFVEQECQRRGVRALHLEVERSNIHAQRLYRAWHFADHDRLLMTKPIRELC